MNEQKTIIQRIEQDGFYWFEYSIGSITLIEFTLNKLVN